MSRLMELSVPASILLAFWGVSESSELAYVCTVEHVYKVSDYGKLVESELDDELEGARFAVSRLDGKILGEVLATPSAQSTRVVNRGSHNNSFKAIVDYGDQFQALEVQESQEGKRKPFVAFSMGGVGIVSGVCR